MILSSKLHRCGHNIIHNVIQIWQTTIIKLISSSSSLKAKTVHNKDSNWFSEVFSDFNDSLLPLWICCQWFNYLDLIVLSPYRNCLATLNLHSGSRDWCKTQIESEHKFCLTFLILVPAFAELDLHLNLRFGHTIVKYLTLWQTH